MKTQAWGWLTAAVLAAGLNSSYHSGGMQWAHEILDQVQHNTNAVLALATGRADQFLAEARLVRADHQNPECPLSAAMAQVQNSFEQPQVEFDHFQAMSDREQAQLARLEANRARIEAQVQARLARLQFAGNNFNFDNGDFTPVVVEVPKIRCPRVHVAAPHIPRVRVRVPRIEVPSHVVGIDDASPGPI